MFGLTVSLTTRAPRPAPGVSWSAPSSVSFEGSASIEANARVAQRVEVAFSGAGSLTATVASGGGFSSGFGSGFSGGNNASDNRGFNSGFSTGFNSSNR